MVKAFFLGITIAGLMIASGHAQRTAKNETPPAAPNSSERDQVDSSESEDDKTDGDHKKVGPTFDEKFEHWPTDLKINGRILVDNGIENYDSIQEVLERVVGKKNVVGFCHQSSADNLLGRSLQSLAGEFKQIESATLPLADLRSALRDADVILLRGAGMKLDAASLGALKSDFDSFIGKGGTLVLDDTSAKYFGSHYHDSVADSEATTIADGLNLLPDCVLECQFDGGSDSTNKLLSALARFPKSVGVGLAPNTLLMLSGRKMTCYGDGNATFMLMADRYRPLRVESIKPRQRRMDPEDFLVDLTEWRRDAIDRTIGQFPPANPAKPFVGNGTLVIVGGGGMPSGLMERIVELAGGIENAKMVYIPCSESEDVREQQSTVEAWKRMGVKHATIVHTKDRQKANSDEDFLAPLKDATGLWFGGGRQWNFSDSYYGTKAHELMKQVLDRGGVIGGSSAGASIQGRYLARATPIGNSRIMAPGYERGGLGFLSGVAIDQHFSQRRRHKDMTQLVNRYPQLLGIGLDEATAIIVQKSRAEVVGRGKVHFYDRNRPVFPDLPDYIALPDGSSFDLATRETILDSGLDPRAKSEPGDDAEKGEDK